jgi:hypothetical protein
MAPPTPYARLRITSLKFISAVDAGAQGPIANVALIKRAAEGDEFEAVCKVALASEKMGLVFGWALASTLDGGKTPHVDLQKDAIVGDDDLIKVAAAFMEAGAPSDVLHADAPDGRVLFCLPLTADVLKALGLQSDVHGLAIGMRPGPETFKRFLSGELNAFSIGGIGERELVKQTVEAAVPAVLAETAPDDDEKRCPGCGAECDPDDRYCAMCGKPLCAEAIPQPVTDEPSSGKTSVVVVAARAPGAISTPASPPPTVASNSQESPHMDPKFAKMLATALVLPDAHRFHVAKLAPEDQVAFLGMSPADQDSAVKASDAADPEVYKTTSGLSIRKSHGAIAEQMARQADATAAELAKQAQQLETEKAARASVQLEKRATDLIPLIGKSLAERVAILKAVDAIADEATRTGALEALKGANAAFQMLGKSIGAGDDGGPVHKTPIESWNDGLAAFAKSKNIANPLDAIGAFLKTAEGKAAKTALDAAQRASAAQAA